MNELIDLLKNTAPFLAAALGGPATIATGVLAWLAGKVTGDPNSSVSSVASQLLQNKARIDELEAEYKLEVLKVDAQQEDDQLQIDKSEADSESIFVSGGRPAIIWIGALALFNNFIVSPYLIALGFHVPILDINSLMGIILPLLGISGLRTFEKIQKK